MLSSVTVTTSAKTLASTQRLTLHVGDTKQLKTWKDNVKWLVPDKKYVSVSKTGKIQALKKGNTTITAIHKNKKKKFILTIKNSYFDIDLNDIAKVEVRHLNYGFLTLINNEDIIQIKKLLEENIFYRYIPVKKGKTGGMRYNIIMYNSDNEISSHITVNDKEIHYYYKGLYKPELYKAKKTLDLSFFDNLFANYSLFVQ
jgi:Bacterial Ig-like domain (group 2).